MRNVFLIFCTAFLFVSVATADDISKSSLVREKMQSFTDENIISGSVTIVATKDKLLQLESVGYADLNKKERMRPDHLFWIASMTKPMTGVCVMILQDEGKLSVSDSVERYLPEFKGQWMVKSRSKKNLNLEPASRPITILDLLTHTSGLANVARPRGDSTLAELTMAASKTPLNFVPGSRWQYSNTGINTLGRIVEVVSGMAFSNFLKDRLLIPCGMKDTTFWPDISQSSRVAKSYRPNKEGVLEETKVFIVDGKLSDRKRTPFASGGLYSTAADVTAFYQMMLNGGVSQGKRLLKKKTVKQMTQTQTGNIETGFVDGMSWGLGFQVVKKSKGATGMLSSGTYGHGGAYATQSWADPKTGLIYVLMIQRAGFPNGDNSLVRKGFQQAAVDEFVR
jgi:CubicO group peptidase (beta-lactamase class C family)